MKKKLTLFTAALFTFMCNAKATDVIVDPATTGFVDAYTAASSGDVLVLMDGTYNVSATLNMTKAITIRSQNPFGAAIQGLTFVFNSSNSGNLTVRDIVLDGTKSTGVASYVIDFNGSYPLAVNTILFENCKIENYGNCFLRANRGECTCENLTINNCVIKNNGSASAYPFFQTTKTKFGTGSLRLTNSTIINFANEYIQNYNTTAGGDNTATYLFEKNTFYNTATNNSRRPISFNSGLCYVRNNIFVKGAAAARTVTEVSINAAVAAAELTNNVIYDYDEGALLNSTGWTLSQGNQDINPNFADAANNNFMLPTGSALIAANIGDPRWFPAPTSIDAINFTTDANSRVDVYSVDGRKIRTNIQVSDLKMVLDNGIYIINKKKVVIKK